MLRKAELRKLLVEIPHDPVAGHLGNDTGGGNRERKPVSLDDPIMRKGEIFDRQAVDQAMIRHNGEAFHGPAHCQMGRFEDVDLIDFLTTCGSDRP